MRTIIAGSRRFSASKENYAKVKDLITDVPWLITEVVSGGAVGPDTIGEFWAWDNQVPIKRFIPEWPKFGKGAGYQRNVEMAKSADALIALWDGISRGTGHMIDTARKMGLKVQVYMIEVTDEKTTSSRATGTVS